MISLTDALRVMASKDEAGNFIPFDIKLVELNLREGTGGRRVTYQNAVLAGGPFGKSSTPKNANHFINGTRNIMVPGKDRPRKIHNLLLLELNGERVYV